MKRVLVVLGLVLLVLTTGSPAAAATDVSNEAHIVFSGDVFVPEGDVTGTIVAFDGDVQIDGRVRGSVLAFNGDVTVRGSVSDTVIALSGGVDVEGGAVSGDVWATERPVVSNEGRIGGEYGRWSPARFGELAAIVSRLGFWFAGSVSTLVLGLLFLLFAPRALDALAGVVRDGVGQSLGVGLLVFFGLPLAAIAGFMSIVGIPFGLWISLALLAIYAVGYTISAWVIGTAITKKDRATAFFAGWLILRGIAIVPFVGGVAWFAAAVVGLGVIGVTIWRARTPLAAPPVPAAS